MAEFNDPDMDLFVPLQVFRDDVMDASSRRRIREDSKLGPITQSEVEEMLGLIFDELINASNDAAAAAAGVPVNKPYRNGSVVMVRIS